MYTIQQSPHIVYAENEQETYFWNSQSYSSYITTPYVYNKSAYLAVFVLKRIVLSGQFDKDE